MRGGLLFTQDCRSPTGLSSIHECQWRPGSGMVIMQIGDGTQPDSSQEATNQKVCRPPTRQLLLLHFISLSVALVADLDWERQKMFQYFSPTSQDCQGMMYSRF